MYLGDSAPPSIHLYFFLMGYIPFGESLAGRSVKAGQNPSPLQYFLRLVQELISEARIPQKESISTNY